MGSETFTLVEKGYCALLSIYEKYIKREYICLPLQIFPNAKGMPSMGPVPLPAEAPTLAEIEHNMMAREQRKPRVLTAEEVERQLRGEPPLAADPRHHFSVPDQIPPVGTSVAFRRPVSIN